MIAFHGLWGALAAGVLTLAAVSLLGVIISVAKLVRLRSDRKTVDAVERHELVDFSNLVIQHVREELRTGSVDDEILVVKAQVERKTSRWRMAACGLAALAVVAGVLAFVTIRRNIAVASAMIAANEDLSKEVTNLIQGVWGWKYDFERSCSQNPHTITVSQAEDKLTVTTTKPHWNGTQFVRSDVFDILARNRRGLTLGISGAVGNAAGAGQRVTWEFVFQDRNTYYVKRSDIPTATTGIIVRCPAQ